jgi:alpha-galactosidase
VSKEPWRFYQKMSDALLATKRPILYAICNWGLNQPWTWAPKMANMWRTTHDIFPYYPWVFTLVDMQNLFAKYAGPGHWNDPDILEVGVNGNIANQPWMPKTNLTERECRSHFDMWSIVAAPLILGHDIRKTPEWVKKNYFQ